MRAGLEAKGYLSRCEQQIGLCVSDLSGPMLQLARQLATAGTTTGARTTDILSQVPLLTAPASQMRNMCVASTGEHP